MPTIKRLEAQDGPLGGRSDTGDKIRRALEVAGIEFIDENGGGPGVRATKAATQKELKPRPVGRGVARMRSRAIHSIK